jgi:hypothetical protein
MFFFFCDSTLEGGNKMMANTSLCSAAAFIHDARIVSEMAAAVGNVNASRQLHTLAASLITDFNTIWLHRNHLQEDDAGAGAGAGAEVKMPTNVTYASGKQTELALPLWLGIVPPDNIADIVAALVASIQVHGNHITTGILGTRAVFEALALHGEIDVALAVLTTTTYPSFGYMVEGNVYEPSTTLWETWEVDTDMDQSGASRNHIAFGTVSAFFWKWLTGLRAVEPGWRRFAVAPSLPSSRRSRMSSSGGGQWDRVLSWLDATLATVVGEIQVEWAINVIQTERSFNNGAPAIADCEMVSLNVTVPVGAAGGADVVVPLLLPHNSDGGGDGGAAVVSVNGAVVWTDEQFITTSHFHNEKENHFSKAASEVGTAGSLPSPFTHTGGGATGVLAAHRVKDGPHAKKVSFKVAANATYHFLWCS